MARVLVTDGEQRAALAVVRSLGRAGHEVGVCAQQPASLAGSSRHCRSQFTVGDPLRDGDAFADQVAAAIAESGAEVVLPVTEAAVAALLPRREQLGARLPFPSLHAFEAVCNKQLVLERARHVGIDVPRQHVIASPADHVRNDSDRLRFPLVVKPARSVVQNGTGRVKTSVVHVADADALTRLVHSLPAYAYPLLLQERITGEGVGVFVLVWQGRIVAAFSHRRLREKPPSGGVSVLCESQPLDANLLARSHALLRSFDWDGVAMVEYKLDPASGRHYLMEINGRFWGSLQLAIDAGVDFPALLVELALGRRPAEAESFRHGVRSRWFFGDLDHLIARLRRSPAELSLPADSGGRVTAVRDFLAACGPRARSEVLRLTDPLPAAREAAVWVRQLRGNTRASA